MEKSFCRIIRRFDSHHNAFAGDLDDIDFAPHRMLNRKHMVIESWLVILSLVAEMRKKASVKLSDALIHITSPALASDIFGLLQNDELEIYETREKRQAFTTAV